MTSSKATGTTICRRLAADCSCSNWPPPSRPVARRDLHLLVQRCGRLLNEGPQIAASNVGADDNQTFAVLAADLVRAQLQVQIGDLGQRDEADLIGTLCRIGRYRDQQAGHTRYVGANGLW